MGYVLFERFQGIRKDVDPKTNPTALVECTNLEVDKERTLLKLSNGLRSIVNAGVDTSAPNASQIDSMVEWQNNEDSSDNLLIYDRKTNAADRRLWWYKRSINSTGSTYQKQVSTGPPDYSGGLKYRNVTLDKLSYLPWRGGVRIGTGNGQNNFALLFAYYDRTGDNQMFGDVKSFQGNFISLQQWVQQAELFGRARDLKYDPWQNKYYLLTERGVEIRDEHFFIERILEDVVAWQEDNNYYGGLSVTDTYLYAIGENPASPGDFKLVAYNVDEGYSKVAEVTYSSPVRGCDVWADSTDVYVVTFDITTGSEQLDVIRYASDLTGAATIYSDTAAGREPAFGITGDVDYVYVADNQIPGVLRIERTAPYGTSTITFTGVGQLSKVGINKGNSKIYVLDVQTSNTRIIEITLSTFSGYTVTATKNAFFASIDLPVDGKYPNPFGDTSYLIDVKRNIVWGWGDLSFTGDSYRFDMKISATVNGVDSLSGQESFFYSFSIVDIWGQEYHLTNGIQISCSPAADRKIRIFLNIVAETQNILGGGATSSNINDLESAWDIFRRIKKIKIYRAYNSAKHAAWPFTQYRFLDEIDINSDQWVEETADVRYYIDYTDKTDEADLSTVTFEESAGLPERFKPYYVNWAHAAKYGEFFYFGNIYADKALPNTFVRSTYLSPDVVYLLDDNWANTEAEGDSGINGLYEYSNRLAVLKRNNLLLYNDTNFDLRLGIGAYNREAFLPYGSRFFVANENGVFVGNITGFKKISIPIDGAIRQVNKYWLSFDYQDNKLIVFDGTDTFIYDLSNGAWVKRNYDYVDASGQFIVTKGFYQSLFGRFYLFENYSGLVYEKGGYTEAGNLGIDVLLQTGYFKLSGSYSEMILKRLILNYYASESFILSLKYSYVDNSGNVTTSQYDITVPIETNGNMREIYLPEIYCNDFYIYVSKTFSDRFELRSIGVEYEVLRV